MHETDYLTIRKEQNMITQVKKRDGRLEPFNKEKIKNAIFKAMASVGTGNDKLAEELTDDIYLYLEDASSVEDIQDVVVDRLKNSNLEDVYESYVDYRAERTKVRENKTAILNTISTLVLEKESVGSAHKENANINSKTVSGAHYRIGSEASKDYYKRHLIPEEFVEAVDEGKMHIHDMDYYGLSINCMQHDLGYMFRKGFSTGNAYISEPNSISSATALTCVVLQSGQTDLFGGESIPAWDHYMEPYVEKSFKKYFKKHMRRLGLTDVVIEQYLNSNCFMEHTPVFENDQVYKAYSWAKQDTISETDQACQALVFNLNSLACRSGR